MNDQAAGYLLAEARVLHNEERDGARWVSISRGYKAESADLREVFSLRLAEPLDASTKLESALLALCEHVYTITNADADMLSESDAAEAVRYRTRRVRSVSIGDVIVIELPGSIHAFAVEAAGMRRIDVPTTVSIAKELGRS